MVFDFSDLLPSAGPAPPPEAEPMRADAPGSAEELLYELRAGASEMRLWLNDRSESDRLLLHARRHRTDVSPSPR